MQPTGRYRITHGIETSSFDNEQQRMVHHFRIAVVESSTGQTVREFFVSDGDDVRAALRAVDEMMQWLKNAPQ